MADDLTQRAGEHPPRQASLIAIRRDDEKSASFEDFWAFKTGEAQPQKPLVVSPLLFRDVDEGGGHETATEHSSGSIREHAVVAGLGARCRARERRCHRRHRDLCAALRGHGGHIRGDGGARRPGLQRVEDTHTVWYTITPTTDMLLGLLIEPQFAAEVSTSVASGSPGSLSLLRCSFATTQTLDAKAGTTYYIQLASAGTDPGGLIRFGVVQVEPVTLRLAWTPRAHRRRGDHGRRCAAMQSRVAAQF